MSDATLRMILLGDDKTMSKAVKSAGSHVADVGKKVAGLAAAGALGFAAMGGAAVVMGVKTAAMNEQAQVAFTTLLGSSKKAQGFLAQLNTFAANTPFDLPGLIDSSRLLLGVGMDAKKVIPTLTAWGDAAGALGISQDGFNHSMIAVSQSLSAGRINAGDMNQIVQAGIPIWKLMSEATGKTVPQLRKLSSEGKLLSGQVLPLLNKQMEKDYGGSMAKQSKTLNGLWSTLMDNFSQGMASVITPLIPMMKDGLGRATAFLGQVMPKVTAALAAFVAGMRNGTGAGGATVAVLKRLWAILVTTGQVIVNVTKWLLDHKGAVVAATVAVAALVAITRIHAAVMAVQAAGGLLKLIQGTRVVTALTKTWAAVQWLMNAALTANPIGIVIVAVAALSAAIIYAYQHSATFRNIVTGAFDLVKKGAILLALMAVKSFHFLLDVWLTVAGGIVNGAAWAFGWVPGLGPKLQGAAAGFNRFKDNVNATLSRVETNLTVQLHTGGAMAAAASLARYVRSQNYTAVMKVVRPQTSLLTLPGHARGGTNLPAGWSIVGEEGPELRYNPAGSTIIPARETAQILAGRRSGPGGSSGGGALQPVLVQFLDSNGRVTQQKLLELKRQQGGALLGLA